MDVFGCLWEMSTFPKAQLSRLLRLLLSCHNLAPHAPATAPPPEKYMMDWVAMHRDGASGLVTAGGGSGLAILVPWFSGFLQISPGCSSQLFPMLFPMGSPNSKSRKFMF